MRLSGQGEAGFNGALTEIYMLSLELKIVQFLNDGSEIFYEQSIICSAALGDESKHKGKSKLSVGIDAEALSQINL